MRLIMFPQTAIHPVRTECYSFSFESRRHCEETAYVVPVLWETGATDTWQKVSCVISGNAEAIGLAG